MILNLNTNLFFFIFSFNEKLLYIAIEHKSFRTIEFLLLRDDIDINKPVEEDGNF